jgi:release factor glutamine methyltransferase
MTSTTRTPGRRAVEQRVARIGSLDIAYDERVLRPRPWTAAQSQWAAELLAHAGPGPVLELCTGAGHIGLLAILDNERHLVAVDADPVACDYARANAAAAGLADRVEVRHAMLHEALAADERFPVVVADPPWVPSARTTEHPEDPVLAIDGGEDGLAIALGCLEVAAVHLEPDGVFPSSATPPRPRRSPTSSTTVRGSSSRRFASRRRPASSCSYAGSADRRDLRRREVELRGDGCGDHACRSSACSGTTRWSRRAHAPPVTE